MRHKEGRPPKGKAEMAEKAELEKQGKRWWRPYDHVCHLGRFITFMLSLLLACTLECACMHSCCGPALRFFFKSVLLLHTYYMVSVLRRFCTLYTSLLSVPVCLQRTMYGMLTALRSQAREVLPEELHGRLGFPKTVDFIGECAIQTAKNKAEYVCVLVYEYLLYMAAYFLFNWVGSWFPFPLSSK